MIKLKVRLIQLAIILFVSLNSQAQIIEGDLKINNKRQEHTLLLKKDKTLIGRIIFMSKEELEVKIDKENIIKIRRDEILKIIIRDLTPRYGSAQTNLRIIGGINALSMDVIGRSPFFWGNTEVNNQIVKPRFQFGFELEYHGDGRFAISFEPSYVLNEFEVGLSNVSEAFVDTNDPFVTPTEMDIVSTNKEILTFKKHYLPLPIFIKCNLERSKSLVAKIGLLYNLTLFDKTKISTTSQLFGWVTNKKFITPFTPFPDVPHQVIVPYLEPQLTNLDYALCSDFYGCLENEFGVSIGLEKRGLFKDKLDVEFRMDLSTQPDWRFDHAFINGYQMFYINAKYRVNWIR